MAATPQDRARRTDRRAVVPHGLRQRDRPLRYSGIPCARIAGAPADRHIEFATPVLRSGSHRPLPVGGAGLDAAPEWQAPGIEGPARRSCDPARPNWSGHLEEPYHQPGGAAFPRLRPKAREAVRETAI